MSFVSEFLGLPGLRGYWPMNAFDSSGNVFDMSGQGRTLTYTGNPLHNIVSTYNAPYIDLDGTGDYLTRADEAGLDIIGTESYITAGLRGLTIGGWFWFDSTAGNPNFIGKHDNASAAGSAYLLYVLSGNANFIVYSSTTGYDVAGSAISTGQWYFIAGRYTPSSELAIWVNASKTVETSPTPPASLNNVAAAFQIGASAGGSVTNGLASNCFLCAMVLADGIINTLYDNTKSYYGL